MDAKAFLFSEFFFFFLTTPGNLHDCQTTLTFILGSLNFNQSTYIQACENVQILKYFLCEFPWMPTDSLTDFSYKTGGFLEGVLNKSMLKML